MKVTIHQEEQYQETEIIIHCANVDRRLQQLIDTIRQYSFSLVGEWEGKEYHIAIEQILYIDYVDNKTFLYDEKQAYQCKYSLASLEEKLKNMSFVRISKNCLVNLSYLTSTEPYVNHRLKANLSNGEQLIITRNYVDLLKERIHYIKSI